jgi:ribosomal-protein-alanine N-acetyltransferase
MTGADQGIPAGLEVRPMRRGDIGLVAAIEADRHPVATWSASVFHDALDAPDRYLCLVVESAAAHGDVVAYGVLALGDGTADLDNLTVRADHERRGIGSWMLRVLLDEAGGRGAREVLLEVRHDNDPAIALYRADGFIEINRRRGYYAHDLDAVIMRRSVETPGRVADG